MAIAITGVAFIVLTETFFNVLLTLDSLETESDYEKDVRFVRREVIQISDRDEVEKGGDITCAEKRPCGVTGKVSVTWKFTILYFAA